MKQNLKGLKIAITGEFKFGLKFYVKEALQKAGATVTVRPSRNTSALIVGDLGVNIQQRKAEKFNVPIFCEEDLNQLLDGKSFDEVLRDSQKREPEEEVVLPSDPIEAIELLSDGRGTPIYVFEKTAQMAGDNCNVIGGTAPGIEPNRWPRFHENDEQMAHLFTLDLLTTPALKSRFAEFRTISIFCHSPEFNEAWDAGKRFTSVVFSTEAQVARTSYTGELERFSIREVRADLEHKKVSELLRKVPCRANGEPSWVQNDEGFSDFILQFDEDFAPVNLGDRGIMYVFPDLAFWQCH